MFADSSNKRSSDRRIPALTVLRTMLFGSACCFLCATSVADERGENDATANGKTVRTLPNEPTQQVAESSAIAKRVDVDAKSISHQIDQHVRDGYASRSVTPAEGCSERDFVRRIYLDLIGRVPTVSELEAYLDGSSDLNDPNQRRAALIDQLLASEEHVIHFADWMDTLLMGRAGEDKYRQRAGLWRRYLEASIRRNQPWDEFVQEILLARPTDDSTQGAVWFLYERGDDHQKIAEAVAPAIFGVRIECAQCHDHMVVDEIKQSHYWGLVAFFNRGKNESKEGKLHVTESAIGGFSEFADLMGDSTPNLLTFLDAEVVPEPRPSADEKQEDKDELYVSIGKDAPRIPKFSRREQFVNHVVAGHPRLGRALVNRVWALLMGRGIVHPFDEMDSMHDPSHPELLDWLAADFVDSGHDVRRLVRGIVNSQTYQLDSRRPDGGDDPATFAWYLERPLTGEQLSRSIEVVLRGNPVGQSSVVGSFRQSFPDLLADEHVTNVKQGLFLSNSEQLDRLIRESTDDGHLPARLLAMENQAERLELLFQTVYARPASEEESERIADFLDTRQNSMAAIQQVLWALLASAEFRFNH